MKELSPTPLPDVTPPPWGPVKAKLKQALPIEFFACTWERARDEVRRSRSCDWWVFDWPGVDFGWLFGNPYSPLARGYYDHVVGDLEAAIGQAYSQCESRRIAQPPGYKPGLRLALSSRLAGGAIARERGNKPNGLDARLSVSFAPASTPPVNTCPMLPRELFTEPMGFDATIHGPGGGNIRWEVSDQQPILTDPYFEHYGRPLRMYPYPDGANWAGVIHLIFERVVDLRVSFAPRPIPAAVADRVDPNQPLTYDISEGDGFFAIAAVIEVTHLESGQIASRNIVPSLEPGQMSRNLWPSNWRSMSMGSDGFIRHGNVDLPFALDLSSPQYFGLPNVGTYRMRYLLLAYGYQTGPRYIHASAPGVNGKLAMSTRPISFSHMPSLIGYTPGMTNGLIPPFEVTYVRSPVIPAGIQFDAVFDIKHLTTFRFVVKVGNAWDFAVGLVVQAAGWQAWVRLEPGETKYLAGGVSISGMSNWSAYPLHPQSPYYGWGRNWYSSYVGMYSGRFSTWFGLFLTAPDAPQTTPANMPQKRATQRWDRDVAGLGPQHEPRWGAIKKYAHDGRYDYEFSLRQYNLSAAMIANIERSITQPDHQPLIDPATYFVTGYQTTIGSSTNGWWERPWPNYSGWGEGGPPIRVNAEKYTFDGTRNVWMPVQAEAIILTRAMMRQVAALLGITDYVVMDGDDIRWFVPVNYNPPAYPESFSNVLWIDRFYTRGGALIDDAAMRAAFQTVIDNNAASWPNYRNIVIHPAVRFGSFLDDGGFEVGDYLLGPNGDMVEVDSLDDLASVSTRFLYAIKPEFK